MTRSPMRLREINKRRTREAIVRVAIGLFVERGYRATTLVEIAGAAGVAPSTLHAYFPVKSDLIFSIHEVVLESATERLLTRAEPEGAVAALSVWVAEDLPTVLVRYGAEVLVHVRDVINSDPELTTQRRFRLALLQDVFAAAFANDSRLAPNPLRAQVMATVAMLAIDEIFEAWSDWYAHDSPQDDVALAELSARTTKHVRSLLEGSMKAIEFLPDPAAGALEFRDARPAS